jgi:hypothetical protein
VTKLSDSDPGIVIDIDETSWRVDVGSTVTLVVAVPKPRAEPTFTPTPQPTTQPTKKPKPTPTKTQTPSPDPTETTEPPPDEEGG